jgi:ribulose 1,5-bisphosphate carboxylase large subunit-like protein
MHAVIDRQKNHGMHFRVLAKALRMSGVAMRREAKKTKVEMLCSKRRFRRMEYYSKF